MKKVITEHSNLLGDDYLSIGKLFLIFWGKFLPHLQYVHCQRRGSKFLGSYKKTEYCALCKTGSHGSSAKLYLFIYLFIFIVHPVTHVTPDTSRATTHYIHFIKYYIYKPYNTEKKKPKSQIHHIKTNIRGLYRK